MPRSWCEDASNGAAQSVWLWHGLAAPQCAIGNVPATEALRPVDAVDRRIGLGTRRRRVLVPCHHVEHAPAIRDEPAIHEPGPGMKDLDRGIAGGRLGHAA